MTQKALKLKFKLPITLALALTISLWAPLALADSSILSPEENLWLKERNNTIVVYPEKNFPPFSYENSAGSPQGLSIDYIEFIANKLGIKIQYLQARPKSQILDDIQNGKGDVVTSIADTKDRENFLYFTDNYISVPAVIVTRKDSDQNIKNINDLTGKKVAIGDKYAVEDFVRQNNPRTIIESMTDDEVSLQQLVLGEVDAAVMDIASFSYYISKQVLNSVKVVGDTGFEYKLAFAVPKDKQILQSILDKGLQQISNNDRKTFDDKWIIAPGYQTGDNLSYAAQMQDFMTSGAFYMLFTLLVAIAVIVLVRHRHRYGSFRRRRNSVEELQNEIEELEDTNKDLASELKDIKTLEEDIQNKIKHIEPNG